MRNVEEAVRNAVRENAAAWLLDPASRDREMLRLVGDAAAQVYHYLRDVARVEWAAVSQARTSDIYSELIKRVSK